MSFDLPMNPQTFSYADARPKKYVWPAGKQTELRRQVTERVLSRLLPDTSIENVALFGSLAKGTFGEYQRPFHRRRYSDIDVLLVVGPGFRAPKNWRVRLACKMYTVYNGGQICRKLVQYSVCSQRNRRNRIFQKEAETWGVPLKLGRSTHKNTIIYEK